MKKRGVITVFLTLMLSVIALFILMLARSARIYIARGEAEYAFDNAVRSLFSEYNRELFERFDILLIDSSYKGEEGGIDRIEDHFSTYLSESLSANELCEVSVEAGPGDKRVVSSEDFEAEYLTECMREGGSPGFDIDDCYSSLVLSARFYNPVTGEYCITREYSYD